MTDRRRLTKLYAEERAAFEEQHPRSKAAYGAAGHLFGRVPRTWMNKAAEGFPVYLDRARGNRVWDMDGLEYFDFALGDTGAMAGHAPAVTVEAVQRRNAEQGKITTMLPTEDAEWVGAELTRRFGMDRWSSPRSPGPSPRACELEDYLHLYLANRGVLLTPFHNMALMCPDTSLAT